MDLCLYVGTSKVSTGIDLSLAVRITGLCLGGVELYCLCGGVDVHAPGE